MASAALGALLGVFQISCCLGFFSLLHRESVCAVALWYAGSGVKQSTPQSALLTPKHAAHSCSTVCQHGARAVQQSVSRLSSTGCSTLQSITVQKTNLHKTSMQLDARPLFKFPTSNLGHLKSVQLSLCYLKAVPAPSAEGSITDLGVSTTAEEAAAHLQPSSPFTSLRKLELSDVMPNSNSCFVASWTTLHSLHLDSRRVEHVTESDAAAKEIPFTSQMDTITFPPQMAAVLPHLTQLRQLTLKYDSMWRCKDVEAASFAACLGSLHQLQDLRLHIDGLNCQHIAQLPTSLTGLEMQEPMDLCPETTPRLTELTQLQHLQLFAAHSFSPALLSHWTQLTWLSITCSLQRCSHSAMYRMSNDLTEFEDLMVALQQLTGLQHLNLSRSLKRKLPAGSTGLYSALTASNQLTELLYIGCFISDGAFQHVFRGVSACEALAVVAAPADVFCNPGTFKRFVPCCPALQQLQLMGDKYMGHARSCDIDWQVCLHLSGSS